MNQMAHLTLGLDAEILGIMTAFCATNREQLDRPGFPPEVYEKAEIHVTAFYRRIHRGGFLVRVRHNPEATDHSEPYLHIAVVEHGSTGEPTVIEWVANWDETPPTKTYPKRAKVKRFRSPCRVVDHLFKRVREHLAGPVLVRLPDKKRRNSPLRVVDPVTVVHTDGRTRAEFVDRYGNPCSVQESTLATEPAMWLGRDGNRMHLTRARAAELLPLLREFVDTGALASLRTPRVGVPIEALKGELCVVLGHGPVPEWLSSKGATGDEVWTIARAQVRNIDVLGHKRDGGWAWLVQRADMTANDPAVIAWSDVDAKTRGK